ncbi:MAG: metallophosphoesterase [Acidobacteriota bacterium]|nr:metallophosphoesterase [Acidobacteriota bacterium]
MARFKQFHDPELSIWQAAVGEVEAQRSVGAQTLDVGAPIVVTGRPDDLDDMSSEAIAYCNQVDTGTPIAQATAGHPATEGLLQTAGFCSLTALKIAKAKLLGNATALEQYKNELAKFGDCDPKYAEAAAKYAEYFVAQQKQIPYIPYKNLSDFVIDGKFPAQAKIAIVGDWGTGQETAKLVLRQIMNKNPDVVIHLGDIYYAGTQFEVTSYFLQLWQQVLNLGPNFDRIPTFTLTGNHDMYSGGAPYYQLIKQLGQPASYFCLRNANWQFVAMDTGYNDHNPSAAGAGATYLQDPEVTWLADKVNNAGARNTVLLSHHQLFTAYDSIANKEINLRLYTQVSPFLPKVALWIWGHEHDFVPYDSYQNLKRSCCLGHGAFPVGMDELPKDPKYADVPVIKDASGKNMRLGITDGQYNHGYAIIEIDGAAGKVSYYQDSDEDTPMLTQSLT